MMHYQWMLWLVIVLCLAQIVLSQNIYLPFEIPYSVEITMNSYNDDTIKIRYSIPEAQLHDTIFCFQEKNFFYEDGQPVIENMVLKSNESLKCQLRSSNDQYFCARLYRTDSTTYQVAFYKTNITQSKNNKNIQFYTFDTLIQLEKTDYLQSYSGNDITIKNFFSGSKVYQVKICSRYLKSSNLCSTLRSGYMHTFKHKNLVDSLLMPRNYQCFTFNRKIISIFTGGALRSSQQVFFMAFLVTNYLMRDLNMWIGYAYNKEHSQSDMAAFDSSTGKVDDLFSLYASAPYSDTDSNINGKNNIVTIANSYDSNQENIYDYYVQFYRLYDTGDTKADEKLFPKINNKHCFGATFNDQNQLPQLAVSRSSYHQILQCWRADLSLRQSNMQFFIVGFMMMIILL